MTISKYKFHITGNFSKLTKIFVEQSECTESIRKTIFNMEILLHILTTETNVVQTFLTIFVVVNPLSQICKFEISF